MIGLRQWGTPYGTKNSNIYYWVSNDSVFNLTGGITNNVGSSGGISSFNPNIGSVRTPMFLQNSILSAPLAEIEYRWFDDSIDPLGTLFVVVFVDWYLRNAIVSAVDDATISSLTPQNRLYVKQVLVANPTSGNNISYRNDSHRTVYLEFWNHANNVRLYLLEVPSRTTVSHNCTVNLADVGAIRIGSYTDNIGGYSYGISKGASFSNKPIFHHLSMPIGGGSYAYAGSGFSGTNSYYPLFFFTENNALTGGTFG